MTRVGHSWGLKCLRLRSQHLNLGVFSVSDLYTSFPPPQLRLHIALIDWSASINTCLSQFVYKNIPARFNSLGLHTPILESTEVMSRFSSTTPTRGWLYDLILRIFSLTVDLFFREIQVRGAWRVPSGGPVILVAAPHSNQVDFSLQNSCFYI